VIPWDGALRKNPKMIEYLEEEDRKKVIPISPFVDTPSEALEHRWDACATALEHRQDACATTEESDNPTFEWDWERYDYLTQKKDPAIYTEKDHYFLNYYVMTSEYKSIYGRKASGQ
jgi:hypothetical protein